MDAAKQSACSAIDEQAEVLQEISQQIWEHPEENFEEVYAHGALTQFLEKQAFPVEQHYVSKTGFKSTIGSSEAGPHIAVLCEYDALPEIGHACGHNLIAEAGLAAGIGIRAAMKQAGKPLGKLTILGTPAEEGGGGKIDMIDAGAFSDVDVAMMVHPSPYNWAAAKMLAIETKPDGILSNVMLTNDRQLTILGTPAEEGGGGKIDMIDAGAFSDVDVAMMVHPSPYNLAAARKLAVETYLTILGTPAEEGGGGKIDMIDAGAFSDVDVAMMVHPFPCNWAGVNTLAIETVKVKYHGRAAHASAFPWQGINALDAAVLCYQNVSTMRQQFKPTWRVHGVIRNGGAKPNIIPELTELEFYARTPSRAELEDLKASLDKCFHGAATSTGCTAEVNWQGRAYLDVINNTVMSDLFYENAVKLGVDFESHGTGHLGTDIPTGSTDMGNVSYVVPSIHPMYYIGSDSVNHTRDFTGASGDQKAQPYTLAVAKAMALTAIDIFYQPDALTKIKAEFQKAPK